MVAVALAWLPIASVAVPLMTWFAPSVVTVCAGGHETTGAPPVQTNVTVTGVLFHPAAFGAGATEATICSGGNGCRLNWMLVVAVLPAISVALPLKVWKPAVVTVMGAGQIAIPDRLSLQVNVTVAETAWIIPLASGAGETAAEMTGGVLSSLMVRLALEVCAAASVTVPLTAWLAPSMETVCEAGHCSGGTPPAHTKETVTSELFHPAAFGAGAAMAVTESGANCTLNVTLVEAVFPALSVADPLNTCPAPAVVTVIGAGQTSTPESPSLQANVMTAGAVTTLFAPGTGATVAVITGAVLSMFSVVLALAVCPAASVAVELMTWLAPSSVTVCGAGHCSGGTPPEQA